MKYLCRCDVVITSVLIFLVVETFDDSGCKAKGSGKAHGVCSRLMACTSLEITATLTNATGSAVFGGNKGVASELLIKQQPGAATTAIIEIKSVLS